MIHARFYARVCCGKHNVVGVQAAADAGYFFVCRVFNSYLSPRVPQRAPLFYGVQPAADAGNCFVFRFLTCKVLP